MRGRARVSATAAPEKKEAHRVERKGCWRTGRGHKKAADDRPADPRALPRETLDSIPRNENLFGHKLGNDRAKGGDTEGADRSEQRIRNEEVPHLKGIRESQDRDGADDHAAAELGNDDEGPSRDAIRDGAPDQ